MSAKNFSKNCYVSFPFYAFLLTLLSLLGSSGKVVGQPWNYNFGTGTGTFSSTTASTTFLPTPTSGTARVRQGTNPGSMVLANPGLTSLGTDSELQFTSNTSSTSTSKFSIHDYTASKTGYVKFTIAFNGGTNGVYLFNLGDGATFSDNNAIAPAQIFAGIRFTLGASNTVTYNVWDGTNYISTGLTNPTTLFAQGTGASNVYQVEVYANNTTASTTYLRGGTTYTLANAKWDLWVNGTLVGAGLAKGGLGTNANFDSFAFNHQVSSTAPGTLYLDDIEYSNALPSGFTVTFNSNGGTGTMANQTASTSTPLTANAFSRTGYSFAGWNTLANGLGTSYADVASYPFTVSTTLYAQWTPNNNTITFDGNGATGGSMGTQTIPTAGSASLSTNGFTRTGYNFMGWATTPTGAVAYADGASYVMGTSSVTLYAVWLAVGTHTVVFNANGGLGTMVNQVFNTTANLSSNTFTRPGYTFAGWNTASNGSGTSYTDGQSYDFSADLTLYAQWTANNNTLTFDANGGAGTMASQTVATDASITLPGNTFTRAGYTFAGWSTTAGGAVAFANGASFTMGTSNATLFAVWNANTYTVTFNGNGSDGGSMANQNYVTGTTANLTTNAFTRTGYTFSGWNTLADGSGTSYANSASYTMGTSNVTLYAQWVVYVGPCFSANAPTFSTSGSTTNPGDTDAGGSPTNTIRLASGSSGGSISTTATGVTAGNVTLKFRAKAWSSTETSVTVTLDGQVVNVTNLPVTFGEITLVFNNVSPNPTLTFSTIPDKRVHIGNVSMFCSAPTDPYITATPTSVSSMNYTFGSGPSGVQSFTVAGGLLTSDLLVTAPTDYEISLSSTTGFGSTVTLSPAAGTVAPTLVYVRLKAGLAVGTYNGQTIVCSATGATSVNVTCGGTVSAPLPVVTLSSANPAVSAGTITQNTNDNVIYAFSLTASNANATVNSIAINTSYTGSTVTNLRLYYSVDNTFNGGTDVVLKNIASPGTSGTETFTSLAHGITNGSTGYYFVTCDVSCISLGSTVSVSALATTNITVASGSVTGSASASGALSVAPATPVAPTSVTTSNCQNTGSTVSWTAPAPCLSEVLVFAKAGSFTGLVPTGDGTTYTANAAFGSGTPFDGGFCIYKGTGTSVNVTGLTLGTTYTFIVFTRNGSLWSATGTTATCTPVIGYCTAASTNSGFEFIQGVDIVSLAGTISNPSTATYYSDFTSLSATVARTETISLTIYNGDYYSSDIVRIWIDYNQDGDFTDAGEQVFVSLAGASAPYLVSIPIPATASLGTTRLRIRLYDSSTGTSNATPCGTHTYGEVEDYSLIIVDPCVPTHSLASFAPISGPVGTYVTVTGTGFTAASQVFFGGVLATDVTFVSSTTLIARFPAGATSGKIKVTENGCYVLSTTAFTLIEESGSCFSALNAGFTDLFISEIYDSESGNVAYVELFNPTPNPIDLAALSYSIGIDNKTAAGAPGAFDRTVALTGIVAPYSVFLVNLGTSPNACSKPWDFSLGGAGFNEYDNVVLIKNGVNVDRVDCPSSTGFTITRNGNATAPTMAYTSTSWTLLNTEDCANLGIGPIATFSNPTVTLTDNSACDLDMSVGVTEGDLATPGDVTYKWYYNDGVSTTWTQVTSSAPAGYTIVGETTSNLQINAGINPIGQLNNYQFHCEIAEAATCVNVSEAVKFETGSRPIYRSVAGSTGDWTTVANWEMANTLAGPWVAACDYPKAANSSEAIIQTGTQITLNITNDIDKLTIDGFLEILPASQLTVYDSVAAGADLILNGTLLYRADAAHGLVFATTSTWVFQSGATLIKTNSADAAVLRDKFEGGMTNMPAVGSWIYRYNGDGEPFTGTESFFYPDLVIENTSGTGNFAFATSTTAFNGAAGFATVRGNMTVGVTGTGTVSLFNNNTNANPMLVLGYLQVAAGSIFSNELCATCGTASGSINHGTGVELRGNLIVDGTLQILTGTTERVLRFTGTAVQNVSGAGTIALHKVTVNKTSGYVNLTRDLQARSELAMLQGHVYTNTSLFELGENTTNKGTLAYTSGYVVGKMRRWFNGTNAGYATGLFPMGVDDTGLKNRFSLIEYTTAPSTGGHLTVEFIETAMGMAGLTIPAASTGGFGYDVSSTEDQGYWKIDNQATALTDGEYRISCTGEGFTTINDLSQITLLKRVGGGNWFCPGTHVAPTGSIAVPTATRSGVSGWSNFGFGAPASVNPLPVELVQFYAQCDGEAITISWATASEQNAAYFEVEESVDGVQWRPISKVNAAGHSSHLSLYETQAAGHAGTKYFRLVQVDLDGATTVSSPISTSCEPQSILVYPNPANDWLFVHHVPGSAELILYAADGRVVMQETLSSSQASISLQGLAQGSYHLQIRSQGMIRFQEKVVRLAQ